MSDRDKLQRILKARAERDVASLTDGELAAFMHDLGESLAATRVQSEELDHRERRELACRGGDLFLPLVDVMREHVRRRAAQEVEATHE